MAKKLNDIQFENKTVLVRCDFNVPLKDGKITDDNRIKAALPTIEKLIKDGAKIVLFSHLGRIKEAKDLETKSLLPVAKDLSSKLGKEVIFIPETRGEVLETAIKNMKSGDVLMFENTRFEDLDGKKESKNNPELGKYWASLGDVFVNDAFGTAHRAHASNDGIASNVGESCVGFLVQKELDMLGGGLDNPKPPVVAIVGGSKVSDKIALIDNMLTKADKVLVGGGMAYTFLKAMGYEIGKSLVEEDKIALAKEYLTKANGKIVLPVDHAMAVEFKDTTPVYSSDANVDADKLALDIGPKTIALYEKELQGAKTVILNGPMGVFEMENFKVGTVAICKAMSNLEGAFTLIGGGDSAAAAIQNGLADGFTHISTGGGASLTYMEGKELVGLSAIQK